MKHHVTLHAIVRFLERIEGIDIDALCLRIAPHDVSKMLDGEYPVGESHMIRVRDGAVVTVYVHPTAKMLRERDKGSSKSHGNRGKQHGKTKKRKAKEPRPRSKRSDYEE